MVVGVVRRANAARKGGLAAAGVVDGASRGKLIGGVVGCRAAVGDVASVVVAEAAALSLRPKGLRP